MLTRTLQSCCCRILVWGVVWGSLCFLFQQVLQTCCKVACRLLGPWRLGVVCKLLLLRRWWCWWGCIWGCCIVVSTSLLQVLLLQQAALCLWALLLLFLLLIAVVGRCCPVGPCMRRTCTSIPQLLHCFHRMLEVLTSAYVLMLGRRLLMLLLCHVPLPSLLSRVPHAMFSWDQALFLCACCLSVCLLGCYPRCCSCCSCWSSPGCFQDQCSATMWKSRQLMLTLCCSCCCTRLLYCWHTKAQGLVDPRCCTYVHWHNWCCERVLILNIYILIYMYIYLLYLYTFV